MRVVADAYNDLRSHHGLAPNIQPRPPAFQRHCLAADPDGLWVAEQAAAVVGFSFAWSCQDFWYLAQLFIKPGLQSAGIGQALLDKALALETRRRTTNRALITLAYNSASAGLYIRNGLYPRQPLYRMQASAERLRGRLGASGYETAPLPQGPPGWIGGLDAQVLGFRRDDHHRFQAQNPSVRGIQIVRAGNPIGYAYITDGHIGPLAISSVADAVQAVTAALRAALAENPAQISLLIPGAAEGVIHTAIGLGFRIEEPMVLLSAKPFGNWGCYLPNNPGYL
jgi:GNAT superfamily N-acetyltransferase